MNINTETFRNVRKMPALFTIDRVNNIGTDEINPASEWIFTEPAIATIKRDGTNITVMSDGSVWARRAVKKGKVAPPNFILAETDSITGHSFGVEPMNQSSFKKFILEALKNFEGELTEGTFELVGPRVQGNPENFEKHMLIPHGTEIATEIPNMLEINKEEAHSVLKEIFTDFKNRGIEGVVWAGAEGKRVKLRVKDFFGNSHR